MSELRCSVIVAAIACLGAGLPAELWLKEGASLRADGELSAAAASFKEGLRRLPQNLSLRLELAITEAWRGEYDAALALYRGVVAESPQHLAARHGVARTLFWAGDFDGSLAHYRALLRDHPEDREAQLAFAQVLAASMALDDAEAMYRRILADDPGDARAKKGLAQLSRITRTRLEFFSRADAVRESQWRFGVGVRAHHRLSRTLGASAQWAMAAPQGRQPLAVGAGRVQRLRAAVDWRALPTLTLVGSYQVELGDAVAHAVGLELAGVPFESTEATVGTRLQRSGDGREGHLSYLSLRRTLDRRRGVWLQGRLYRYDNAGEPGGITLLVSGGARVHRRFVLRLGGGVQRRDDGPQGPLVLAGFDLVLFGELSLAADYELAVSPTRRHGIQTALRWSF